MQTTGSCTVSMRTYPSPQVGHPASKNCCSAIVTVSYVVQGVQHSALIISSIIITRSVTHSWYHCVITTLIKYIMISLAGMRRAISLLSPQQVQGSLSTFRHPQQAWGSTPTGHNWPSWKRGSLLPRFSYQKHCWRLLPHNAGKSGHRSLLNTPTASSRTM